MKKLIIQPTTTATWHALIAEAEFKLSFKLHEELESYLVFLLMRFSNMPDIGHQIIAIEYLKTLRLTRYLKIEKLHTVADQCLLLDGLFPELVHQRRVKTDYFETIGQSAYFILANLSLKQTAKLYYSISEKFATLRNVLRAIRPAELQSAYHYENIFKNLQFPLQ